MTRASIPKVAVIGCGDWGKHLVRNFAELGALHAVCDADPALAAEFAAQFNVPAIGFDAIMDHDCDGIAFASPAALHADHAALALQAGKHVFMEKPLALTVSDGHKVKQIAKAYDRVLMVGHLLHYHPLVVELIRIVQAGILGNVQRVVSNRLGLGKIRTEEDVIWSFAPHDLSVILGILDQLPTAVSAHGTVMTTPGIVDAAVLHLNFAQGVTAQVSVSWLHPFKEQKLSVIGSEGHLVFDDTLDWDKKLVVYPHKVTKGRGGQPTAVKADPVSVVVPRQEPLKAECAHFLTAILNRVEPRTDATEALRVLAVLEAASRSVQTGQPVVPVLD